jgi:hypothetical protein
VGFEPTTHLISTWVDKAPALQWPPWDLFHDPDLRANGMDGQTTYQLGHYLVFSRNAKAPTHFHIAMTYGEHCVLVTFLNSVA